MSEYIPEPTPHEKYTTLEECLRKTNDDYPNIRFLKHAFAQPVGRDIAEWLSHQGFRRFATLANGESAVVFDLSDHQVMRIRYNDSLAGDRAQVIEEIQPIVDRETPSIALEILPKVDPLYTEYTFTLEGAEWEDFGSHCTNKGYALRDFKPTKGDIGRMRDGTFIGVDQSAFDEPDEQSFDPIRDAAWVVKSDEESRLFPYLHGTGYISKQEYLYPALLDGRVRGILSDEDKAMLEQGGLETLRAEKPECFTGIEAANLSEFMQLVFEDGWYPSQAQEMMQERGIIRSTPAAKIQSPQQPPAEDRGWKIG